RYRRPDEVGGQHAAPGAHGCRGRGDGAGPAQRPGPRAGAEDPGQLHRQLGHLEAARSPDGRTYLVSRPRPGPHAAPDPGADRGARHQDRPVPLGVRRGQGGLRQGHGRRLGRPGHRLRARPGVRRLRPGGAAVTPATWSLASYTAAGARGCGVLREDGTLVTPADLKRWSDPLELLEDWAAAESVLRDLDTQHAPAVEYDALLPPLQWPRKVICAGVNYRKHMREMGGEIPEAGWRPFFFLKAPTTSVIGPRDPIVVSSAAMARYDWEAELAVVIGVKGKNIHPERAGFHVAAYSVCNDITARGYHKRDAAPAD